MKNLLNKLVTEVKNNIAHKLKQFLCNSGDGELLKLVLDAYNTYQKEERDGVDYIFDINKPQDLKCCVEGGMTAKEVAWLYAQSLVNTTPYFYFGVNYPIPKPIANYDILVVNLISWLDDVLPCVLAYPSLSESYGNLYRACITDYMINDEMVP